MDVSTVPEFGNKSFQIWNCNLFHVIDASYYYCYQYHFHSELYSWLKMKIKM